MIKTVTINPSLDRYYDVEHIVLDDLHRIVSIQDYPGGKGINAARVLKELGCESVVYSFIGGSNGNTLATLCDTLNTQMIRISNHTRVNHKYRDLSNSAITEFNEFGPEVSEKEFKILEHCLSRDVFDNDWVMLGGSGPRGLSDDVYVKLIDIVHHRHGKVLLCTDMPWLAQGIKNKPDVVKVNLDEFHRLTNKNFANYNEMVTFIREQYLNDIQLFIVSMAKKGAIFVTQDQAFHAYIEKVDVVNDVGAGDAMLAGIVKCLEEATPLDKLAVYCTACATTAILNDDISISDENNVLAYEKKVIVEKL